MSHHHKSNKAVEGNPDTGHGGGLPRRPDDEELQDRTEEEREQADLAPGADAGPEEQYQGEEAEVERQVESGELDSEAGLHRKDRDDFPPTRYDG